MSLELSPDDLLLLGEIVERVGRLARSLEPQVQAGVDRNSVALSVVVAGHLSCLVNDGRRPTDDEYREMLRHVGNDAWQLIGPMRAWIAAMESLGAAPPAGRA